MIWYASTTVQPLPGSPESMPAIGALRRSIAFSSSTRSARRCGSDVPVARTK